MNFQSYVSMLYIRIDDHHLCLASIAKFAMADFEENVEEMVGTTREAAAMATESGGDETATRPRTRLGTRPAVPGTRPAVPGTRPAVPGTRPAATAGDETMATGGVMYIWMKGS